MKILKRTYLCRSGYVKHSISFVYPTVPFCFARDQVVIWGGIMTHQTRYTLHADPAIWQGHRFLDTLQTLLFDKNTGF